MNTEITRRDWLKWSALTLLPASFAEGGGRGEGYAYHLAEVTAPPATLPSDGYVPFDWAVSEIRGDGEGVKLTWKGPISHPSAPVRFRLTSATDVREVCILEVKTARSGKGLGTLDMRFAMYLQPFELVIPAAELPTVWAGGIVLTLTQGTKPFWFFANANTAQTAPPAYLPHLLTPEGAASPEAWQQRLLSRESVQTFGWMEGCVLDGLLEMSARQPRAKAVLRTHLNLFFDQNTLIYADLNNRKAVGKINGVESLLPFAILAQTDMAHPMLQTAVRFCREHANAAGVVADGTGTNRPIKTEECYTVSYPLAVLAKTLQRPDLAELALNTLQARVTRLDRDGSIFQLTREEGNPGFENWSRGVVWYLLGTLKTLAYLPESAQTSSLKAVVVRAVERVISLQQPNGLWYCFQHRPETGLETSGTAGIAAALAYGAARGLLPGSARVAARKARRGLAPYLTPDGYLTGTAQGNKGGLTLQTDGFRAISPYTLGFLAHLETYLP
ncbi:MAG: glycoside hydrolase family 88 protein [Cytophagaceae bacterium]|nr:glycoside hydrolase family 88 protein [Cytophagaceae bacterium]